MKPNSLLAVFLFFMLHIGKAQVNQGDSLALVDLYNQTQPQNGNWDRHTNWLTTAPLNDWYGITVAKNRVTQVKLSNNNLTGKLPSTFLNLTALQRLNFRGNTALSIALNENIDKLANLTNLDLQKTNTTGVIPTQMAQLVNLEYLDMSYCFLQGTLPTSINKLTKLSTLILSHSGLSGALPDNIGNIPSLSTLALDSNRFSGHLPARGSWPSLTYLNLDNNTFSGSLPLWLGSSRALYQLQIDQNAFTGSIPEEWGDSLTRLSTFYASYNHFSGPVPAWLLSGSTTLYDVLLDHNQFSRQDNPCIVLSRFIEEYNLSYNHYNFNGLECLAANGGLRKVNPQAPVRISTRGNRLMVSAGGTLSNNIYTWYRVGGAQPTVVAGDSTFAPPQSGQYYAMVKNKAVTTLTLYTDTVGYTQTAGMNNMTVTASPNPAREQITLYGLTDKADVLVRVADLSGRVWMQAMSRRQTLLRLNTANLKAGRYLMVVSDGAGIKTLPFVKE